MWCSVFVFSQIVSPCWDEGYVLVVTRTTGTGLLRSISNKTYTCLLEWICLSEDSYSLHVDFRMHFSMEQRLWFLSSIFFMKILHTDIEGSTDDYSNAWLFQCTSGMWVLDRIKNIQTFPFMFKTRDNSGKMLITYQSSNSCLQIACYLSKN